MKKLFIAMLIFMAALIPIWAHADTLTDESAGTLTSADWVAYGKAFKLVMIYTDTDGNGTTGIDIPVIDGTFSSPVYNAFVSNVIESCTTDPGATAPDDNYDITIKKKTSGNDVFQGATQNRDTANTETAVPLTAYEHPDETLSLVVENQTQAGAITKITLWVAP